MRVVVIGGHGRVALLLARQLVDGGVAVTSLFRDPDHTAEVADTGATPVIADVEGLDEVRLAGRLAGHDAVVWAAGAGGGDPVRTDAVDRAAAIRSMAAARRAGVDRYVMVSYLGAGRDHGVPPDSSFFAYAEAKAAADEHLRASDLAWTILGPGRLGDGPGTGRIEVSDVPAAEEVPRADVAAVAAAVLARPGTAGRTIPFVSGPTPIGAALDALG